MGRGKSLELLVEMSQRDVICVDKTQAGTKWIKKGTVIQQPGLVDFVGTVCATGQSICFDAKQTNKANGFYLSGLPKHQRDYLIRHGKSKAISGLLIEATHPDLGMVFWAAWELLTLPFQACISFEDDAVIAVGSNSEPIDFRRIPGISSTVVRGLAG